MSADFVPHLLDWNLIRKEYFHSRYGQEELLQ